MRHQIITLVTSVIVGFCSPILACSPTETTFVNTTSKILNVEPTNAQIKHMVAGSVKIMTGCTFFVRNMTIIPSGNAVYWYGIPKSGTEDPYPRTVAMALGSYNGQSVTFTLDSQYSFNDISIMEMRSEGDNRAYGAFAVNGSIELVEDYYKVKRGAGLDMDPTKPFTSSAVENFIVAGVSMFALFNFVWYLLALMFISIL